VVESWPETHRVDRVVAHSPVASPGQDLFQVQTDPEELLENNQELKLILKSNESLQETYPCQEVLPESSRSPVAVRTYWELPIVSDEN
jgi:hypothetical protein